MKKYIALLGLCAAMMFGSCSHIDNNRLPPAAVNIEFVGNWGIYGIKGALDWVRFIKPDSPRDFPWAADTYTGFGGVLIIGDFNGQPMAYDLACPYECKQNIRINVVTDGDDNLIPYGECPVCHSTYDLCMNRGTAMSGPSAQRGYGLTIYRVFPGEYTGSMIVTR